MARKQTIAPSFAPITTEIANAIMAAADGYKFENFELDVEEAAVEMTDKKIDAVLDRVWLGVNTRSAEDEEKKWLDSWMRWMPERK